MLAVYVYAPGASVSTVPVAADFASQTTDARPEKCLPGDGKPYQQTMSERPLLHDST